VLAAEGLSLNEVIGLCRDGIREVRRTPEERRDYVVQVGLIELLLAATELRWRTERQPDAVMEALAEEGVRAAGLSPIPQVLSARMIMLQGKIALHADTIDEAVRLLGEAHRLAHEAGDPCTIFRSKLCRRASRKHKCLVC